MTQPTAFHPPPPKLNLDINAGLDVSIQARDQVMVQTQNAIGLALTAIGQALTHILTSAAFSIGMPWLNVSGMRDVYWQTSSTSSKGPTGVDPAQSARQDLQSSPSDHA